METSDARKLVGAALEERRKSVIRLYRSGKYKTYQEIAEVAGVHRNTASIWIRNWENGGTRTLKAQKRGRPVGCCRRLLPHEEAKVRKDIVDYCPDQLKLPFALWTRQAIRLHIKVSFGVELPIRTVGEYLKRWGFTQQKPIKRAYQRNNAVVQDWLRNKFHAIKKQAKAENAAFIKLCCLPSYSPDLNPGEYLNRDLKSDLNNRPLGRAKGKIEAYAKEHMENLSHDTDRVARLFQAESVRYAS